ncbi:hypothetical protein CONPUDRAFT_62851, partial [Coniophora puteana RWD-64-598 SS2]
KISGKKQDKFWLTIAIACNADNSVKFEPLFIGKVARLQCFYGCSPEQHSYYYKNNKNVWMTSNFFEE